VKLQQAREVLDDVRLDPPVGDHDEPCVRRPAIRPVAQSANGSVAGYEARQARRRGVRGWLAAHRDRRRAIGVAEHEQAARDPALDRDLRTELTGVGEVHQRAPRERPRHAIGERHQERPAIVIRELERVDARALPHEVP